MSEAKQCSCEPKQYGSCEMGMQDHHGKCPCGCGSDHCCPVHMWKASFHEAKKSIMVDILKAKIQKAYGQKMEQTANLILETIEAKKKGEIDLKNKLHEIWEQ